MTDLYPINTIYKMRCRLVAAGVKPTHLILPLAFIPNGWRSLYGMQVSFSQADMAHANAAAICGESERYHVIVWADWDEE